MRSPLITYKRANDAFRLARIPLVLASSASETKVLLLGCTRQIAAPGWEGNGPGGSYQNGGFWGTGTGHVLPALAEQDPAFAVRLAEEPARNLPKTDFAEWIGTDKKPAGALRFLGSVSLPLLGLRSILEKRPLLDYF